MANKHEYFLHILVGAVAGLVIVGFVCYVLTITAEWLLTTNTGRVDVSSIGGLTVVFYYGTRVGRHFNTGTFSKSVVLADIWSFMAMLAGAAAAIGYFTLPGYWPITVIFTPLVLVLGLLLYLAFTKDEDRITPLLEQFKTN